MSSDGAALLPSRYREGDMTTGLFDTESDLPAVVRGLPPEDREQLTFHLPLEVQALEVAGAPYELIVDRIEQRLPVAFAASLVDPPLFLSLIHISEPTRQ